MRIGPRFSRVVIVGVLSGWLAGCRAPRDDVAAPVRNPAASSSVVADAALVQQSSPPEGVAPHGSMRGSGSGESPRAAGPGLSQQQVHSVLSEITAAVGACFEQGLAADPTIGRGAGVAFTIARDGSVQELTVERSSRSQEVDACLAFTVQALSFPAHRGEPIEVRYPLVFEGPLPP